MILFLILGLGAYFLYNTTTNKNACQFLEESGEIFVGLKTTFQRMEYRGANLKEVELQIQELEERILNLPTYQEPHFKKSKRVLLEISILTNLRQISLSQFLLSGDPRYLDEANIPLLGLEKIESEFLNLRETILLKYKLLEKLSLPEKPTSRPI